MLDQQTDGALVRTNGAALILDQLRARRERITTPRRAVIELLAGTHEHLTVDDIASRLHPAHPSIAPSTVYRTLEALQEWGIVEKIHRGQGATFFHLAQAHQHLVCDVCGKVTDIPAYELDDLVRRLRVTYGFELQPSRFALSGQCCEHCADSPLADSPLADSPLADLPLADLPLADSALAVSAQGAPPDGTVGLEAVG
jgi:Fur family ferric uptake transcriptional regulator